MGADRHVERQVGRRVRELPGDLADALGGLLDLPCGGARRCDRRGDPAGESDRCLRHALDAVGGEARRRRARARDPLVIGLGGLGDRLDVEEHGGDVDARDPVDQGMVGLRDQGEAALAQALDQPQLPERLGPVELLGEDPGRHPAKHVLVAGRRQGGMADVVAEVELRVVDPEGATGLDRRDRELLPVPRDEVQPALDMVEQILVARRRPLEDRHPADVHVAGRRLVRQKRSVDRRQPIHVSLGHGRNVSRMSQARCRPPGPAAARQPAPCWRCSWCSRRRRLSAWRAAAGSNPGRGPSGDRRRCLQRREGVRRSAGTGRARPRPAGSAPTCARPADWPPSCGGPGSRTSGSSVRSGTWSASSRVAAAATS